MNSLQVALAFGCVGVLTIDSVGALASRSLGFSYKLLVVPQLGVWLVTGVLASASDSGIAAAAAAGAIVGAVDGSLGWWLSALIGPGKPVLPDGSSPSRSQIVQMALGVPILAAATASIGGIASGFLRATA